MGTADLGDSEKRLGHGQAPGRSGGTLRLARPEDSYGLVLALVILDYVAVSTVSGSGWGNLVIFMLQGLMLFFALRTSGAHRVWVLLAGIFLVVGTAFEALSSLQPEMRGVSEVLTLIGGILLLVTPVVIVRRIITHRVVTAETLLGAICVYVLIGFSFASVFAAIGTFSSVPFFAGVQLATRNEYLFFSYSTLTTVGYGNLVPATGLGQTLAMLEAMLGQIFLVIVVSRLVSLWGQVMPRNVHDS